MNINELTFRTITSDEYDKLEDLFPKHGSEEMWQKFRALRKKQLDAHEVDLYVIDDHGEFIGEMTVCYFSGELPEETIPGKRVYFEAFRLRKDLRNQGIGQQLLAFMLKDLKEKGYSEFTIGVEEDNEIAKHVYFKYGFTEAIAYGTGDEFDPSAYTLYLRRE